MSTDLKTCFRTQVRTRNGADPGKICGGPMKQCKIIMTGYDKDVDAMQDRIQTLARVYCVDVDIGAPPTKSFGQAKAEFRARRVVPKPVV